MNSLNELFFNHSAAEGMTYEDILDDVQKYCTANHADTLSGETDPEQAKKLLKEFILQYLIKCSYGVEGMSSAELCENLYEDMDLPERCGGSKYQCLQRYRGHHQRRTLHEDSGEISVPTACH